MSAPGDVRVPIDVAGPPRRVHLVGIGGAGMSAIAHVLATFGHHVSGSDRADSPVLERLRSAGVDARAGHHVALVDGVDVVAVSTAIPDDDPEVVAARAAGVPVAHRYDLLAAVGAVRRTLSVSGTHGKTTTSALLALALDAAGLDPSFIIGGEVAGFGAGWRWTDGEWLVLEADESDSTFLAPPRAGAIVTNVEPDHLDHHGSVDALFAAFERFVAGTDGPVVVCADDPGSAALIDRCATASSYGWSADAAHVIADVAVAADGGSTWTVTGPDGRVHRLAVDLPGRHLVANATAAFILATLVGADPERAAAGIARYAGVGRRFEHRGDAAGVRFVDDYAHMPAEVRAVLSAARAVPGHRRIVGVFQPHRYSRTAAVWRDYAEAFDDADVVVVTDVYPAGEAPVPGVSGELVADAVRRARPGADVRWMPTRDDLLRDLPELLAGGDLCLTMGAGDLTTLPDQLIAALEGRRP